MYDRNPADFWDNRLFGLDEGLGHEGVILCYASQIWEVFVSVIYACMSYSHGHCLSLGNTMSFSDADYRLDSPE